MTLPLLESIQIQDFRSIRGTIQIPLAAPVVLVHGQNGSGKTSVLSAIELAVTGKIESLRDAESDYAAHLVHKSARSSRISLWGTNTDWARPSLDVSIEAGRITRPFALPATQERFFAERCYLAQSLLARLLEIYQPKDTKSTSPLTAFVKELLQLDKLEALIDGLHDVGNVARLRRSVPEYLEQRDLVEKLAAQIVEVEEQAQTQLDLIAHIDAETERLKEGLRSIRADGQIEPGANDALGETQELYVERRLQTLARARRSCGVIRERLLAIRTSIGEEARSAMLDRLASADQALSEWEAVDGARVRAAAADADLLLGATTSSVEQALVARLAFTIERLETDAVAGRSALARHDNASTRLIEIRQQIEIVSDQRARTEEELSVQGSPSEELARDLAALMTHVKGDRCPVCDRDFREVSDRSLQEHVADALQLLSQQAARIRQLLEIRSETTKALTILERELGAETARLLSAPMYESFGVRVKRLEAAAQMLKSLLDAAAVGQGLMDERVSAYRQAEQSTRNSVELDSIDKELRELSSALSVQVTSDATREELLSVVEASIAAAESTLLRLKKATDELVENEVRSTQTREVLAELEERAASLRVELERQQLAFRESERRLKRMKTVAKLAVDARSSVVRRVFNESLNRVWRDLFVRLAPDEPFIPEFALGGRANGPVEVVLETAYRDGARGGNPRAMLSAGNLNTAALTLFLALHLSVRPSLPWILIDDPVQSMDEVHIAQFAALLRTLAKRHKRQVILAVHEKPLFEYLALELSPSFVGDRLITVELSRSAGGSTEARSEIVEFREDRAVAA